MLDPGTYGEGGTGEENFLAIYEAQEPLGRRLNLLSYDLTDLESGEATNEDVIARLDRLLSLPILADDEHLHTLLAAAEADPEDAAECAREAHLAISDRYRVNRRILRNRRERLISQDRLAAITRVPDQLRYESDQIEDEAVYASEKMLAALSADLSLPSDILRPFSRILLQALVDPIATLEVLTAVRDAEAAAVNSYGRGDAKCRRRFGGGALARPPRHRLRGHQGPCRFRPFLGRTPAGLKLAIVAIVICPLGRAYGRCCAARSLPAGRRWSLQASLASRRDSPHSLKDTCWRRGP